MNAAYSQMSERAWTLKTMAISAAPDRIALTAPSGFGFMRSISQPHTGLVTSAGTDARMIIRAAVSRE